MPDIPCLQMNSQEQQRFFFSEKLKENDRREGNVSQFVRAYKGSREPSDGTLGGRNV